MPPASDTIQPSPSPHEVAAEEVRLYLVTLRGGAPFLSGRDGQILLEWLETGWSVGQITAALDCVADDRTKKKQRARLTLSACKTHLEKQAAKKQSKRRTAPLHSSQSASVPVAAPLDQLIVQIAKLHCARDERPLLEALCTALRDASGQGDAETTARFAVQAVRTFFEQLWVTRSDEHQQLRSEAESNLAPLKGVVKGRNFDALVEEGARQQLRSRFDLVSAQSVWDTLFPGES